MNNFENKYGSDFNSSQENSWGNSSAERKFPRTIWDEKNDEQSNNINPPTDYNGTPYQNNNYYQGNRYAGGNQGYNQNNNFTSYTTQNNNNGYYNNYNGNYNQGGYGYNGNYNQNGYNAGYNQNGYNYNNNYNGVGNYNPDPDRYTYNHQKKFFGGKFQYPIPYTANTVCVEPKRDKLATKLIIALMLTMPIGILLVILSYVLAVVFLTDVFINIVLALISVAFVGILVSLVVILTLGPVMEAISKKRHCKLKLKGVIRDVRYDKTSKGARTFIPLYSYAYNGKEYYFEGAESMFEKFETGSEIELYINEADPTQQYVPDEQKSIAAYHLVMIGLILLAFLITGIAAYCDFH
ncbi:MAG: hypothetical protein UD936_06595 [Acutalibacteraceae bacterium]|nr:hypothetical protein [Acutalibacteraceae bacterium]